MDNVEYGYLTRGSEPVWSDDSGLFDFEGARWYANEFDGWVIARYVSDYWKVEEKF